MTAGAWVVLLGIVVCTPLVWIARSGEGFAPLEPKDRNDCSPPPPPPLPRCHCALTPYPESSWSTVTRLCPKHGLRAPRPPPTSVPS